MVSPRVCLAGLLPAILAGVSTAQEKPTVQDLQKQLREFREETEETVDDLEQRLAATAGQAKALQPGTTGFLMAGYMFAGFENAQGENSTFNAGLNPIVLWRLSDGLFFEGELELELEGGETEVALEYAQVSFVVNDYLTVGAGKFLNPSNYFMERLHPLWINKLPDKPLPFGKNRIQAPSHLGLQARGAAPVGSMRVEYALHVSNGPGLVTDGSSVGSLQFKNFEDSNNGKSVGGRIGFYPIPEVNFGYGLEWGRVSPSGMDGVDAIVQSIDVNVVADCETLKGTFDGRFQYVWSDVDTTTYNVTNVGPVTFSNQRSGAYAQLAYRPTKCENEILQNLEGVVRWDMLNQPVAALTAFDEQRWTLGLNYWFGPSVVAKIAYQIDDKDDPLGGAEDEDVFFLQVSMGF